jgi:hypothetical protein
MPTNIRDTQETETMPTYRVHIDFGDFSTDRTQDATSVADCLRRLRREHKGCSACEMTIRVDPTVGLDSERRTDTHVATLRLDAFGNPEVQILDRVEHPIDLPYAVQTWVDYYFTAAGDLVRAGYAQPTEKELRTALDALLRERQELARQLNGFGIIHTDHAAREQAYALLSR